MTFKKKYLFIFFVLSASLNKTFPSFLFSFLFFSFSFSYVFFLSFLLTCCFSSLFFCFLSFPFFPSFFLLSFFLFLVKVRKQCVGTQQASVVSHTCVCCSLIEYFGFAFYFVTVFNFTVKMSQRSCRYIPL